MNYIFSGCISLAYIVNDNFLENKNVRNKRTPYLGCINVLKYSSE